MNNVQVNLTDLNLLDGDVITVDKMAIIDNNMEELAMGIDFLDPTPVMDKVTVDATGAASDEKNAESFNALIRALIAAGLMESPSK